MRFLFSLAACLFLALPGLCQRIPSGTVLPVKLATTLDSRNARPADRIRATLMQDVVLPSGDRIRARSTVTGRIVETSAASSSRPSRLIIVFDQLRFGQEAVPIVTSLRAIASMTDVFSAQLPTGTFDDYGTSISDWTTIQVGGAAVYLGDATVRDGMQIVGKAPGYGIVTARLIPALKLGCPAAPGQEHPREQALWVFSPWACGAYGFEDLTIQRPVPATPPGAIELASPRNIRIRAGSGLLLVVLPASPPELPPVSK